jgi:multiple sugar transport system permease protein
VPGDALDTTADTPPAATAGGDAPRRRGRSRRSAGDRRFAAAMILPATALIGLVVAYPLVYAFLLSLRESAEPGASWVGLANYGDVLRGSDFWAALKLTLIYTAVAVAVELVLGLAIALILHAREFRAKPVVRSLLLLPLMVAPTVAALEWRWLYNDQYGALSWVLAKLGVPATTWLSNPDVVLYSSVAVDVWQATPFVMLVLVAALQELPMDQVDAARVDGARYSQVFRHVILNHLRPAILVVLLIRTMDAFRVFDIIYVLTGGGPGTSSQTLSIYAYKDGFAGLHLERSSAISFLMVVLMAAISAIYLFALRRRD